MVRPILTHLFPTSLSIRSGEPTVTATLDYAAIYEAEFRPARRVRRAVARVIWAGLFVLRPRVALEILRTR